MVNPKQQENSKATLSNLNKRILSALILAPIILSIIWVGGSLFSTLIIFMSILMILEWNQIINSKKLKDDTVYKRWHLSGVFYVGIFSSSLIYLRNLENGLSLILLMTAIVWATDIAAYFSGRILKGPKILPKVSPSKTWAGLFGGMVASSLVGITSSIFIHLTDEIFMAILCAFLAVVAQAGDFLESWVKRKFDVKDSGNIIPGHGGIMDRVDGLTIISPVFAIITLINSGKIF